MFAIHSNRTIINDAIQDATVFVKDGIIRQIREGFVTEPGIETIDVANNVLMAAVVDTHVHINEPGRTTWEGFETATKACIAGGIGTVVEMPLNASPVTTSLKAFEEKLSAARKNHHINLGFWGGIIPGNENEILSLAHGGVLGFKAFLTHSGIDEFPNVTENDLHKAMPVIAGTGLPLLVHCEMPGHETGYESRSYNDYLLSRPKEWEQDAIALMIRLCREYKTPVHIVHLSSAEELPQVAAAKKEGLPLTVETAQHYLYFNAESIAEGQTQFKCAPPIREKLNNEKLWQGLVDGTIDFVATDHSPAPPEMKALDSGDFSRAWGGISSLQYALPVLWTAARQRGIGLPSIARWLCENPAKLAGLQKTKGKIAVDYDADLLVWKPDNNFTVKEENTLHRHKLCPYTGETLWGTTSQLYLSGIKIFDEGKILHLNKGKIVIHGNR